MGVAVDLKKIKNIKIIYFCHFMLFVMVPEEDVYSSFSYLLLKYYLCEGVMCGHSLLLSSASYHPADILAVSS